MELAVYGKGGIGKSTVSANLSCALALRGHRVLQIGCDPKHDSTRLIMHGEEVETVLGYLRGVSREEEDPGAVLGCGFAGVGCIEAGGPKPGVGCAGRGIISAFEFLSRHDVKKQYDTVLYDVLGDVVCGGFAVPVRREYADVIFLVTSGEFMALYAANNILRGIRNFDEDQYRRVAGIIYNERKIADEDGRVRRFAEAVGLPIVARVPRSDAFAMAEGQKKPLIELPGFEEEKSVFISLAERISGDMPLFAACPLPDEALERIVLGTRSGADPEALQEEDLKTSDGTFLSCGACSAAEQTEEEIPDFDPEAAFRNRMPLYGCAFNGAATCAVHLNDAIVIAHGPKACAFYTLQNITSSGRKNLFNRGILMPSALSPHFASTDIGQAEAVFGGMELLRNKVAEALRKRPGAVIVISSCVSGIIGDDIRSVEAMSTPECPVIAIPADGDIAGDYMHGIEMCMDAVAERLIDRAVVPEGRLVNIVNEAGVSNNISYNYDIVEQLLGEIGVRVNCRYLGDATADEMRHFLKAPLNILSTLNDDSLARRKWLEERYGCHFLEEPFPVGFEETSEWLRKTASFFDVQGADGVIRREKEIFEREIAALRPQLEGKTIVMTTINANLDWLMGAAVKAGMRFLWIGVLNYLHQELNITNHPEYCAEIAPEFDHSVIQKKIDLLRPDLVLSNYTQTMKEGSYIQDSIPMTPRAGFHSAVHILRRWAKLFETGK